MVWSPAVLAAEIDAGLIQEDVAEALVKEGINSEEDIRLTARLQGYGRVLTAAALALVAVKENGRENTHQEIGPGSAGHLPGQRGQGHSKVPALLLPHLRRGHRRRTNAPSGRDVSGPLLRIPPTPAKRSSRWASRTATLSRAGQ